MPKQPNHFVSKFRGEVGQRHKPVAVAIEEAIISDHQGIHPALRNRIKCCRSEIRFAGRVDDLHMNTNPLCFIIQILQLNGDVRRFGVHQHCNTHQARSELSWTIVYGIASALALMFLITSAAAADSDIDNLDACNGKASVSPDLQIEACTALTKSADNPKVLAVIYNNRGSAYVAKEQYDLAIKDYDEAIKDDPGYAKAFNNRGVAYQKKAEYDRAIQDFDAVIKLDPNYANAFANRVETYRKKGDYVSATKDFDEAIRVQPNLSVLQNERCWTRTIMGARQRH